MGNHSRRKGAGWEREVAEILREIYPQAKRGLGQARSGGEVCDVEGTPWWVECKRGKKMSIPAALRQAQAATDGRPVLVIVRNDREPATVTLLLEDWLREAGKSNLFSRTGLIPSP